MHSGGFELIKYHFLYTASVLEPNCRDGFSLNLSYTYHIADWNHVCRNFLIRILLLFYIRFLSRLLCSQYPGPRDPEVNFYMLGMTIFIEFGIYQSFDIYLLNIMTEVGIVINMSVMKYIHQLSIR